MPRFHQDAEMKSYYERRFFIAPEVAVRLSDFVKEYMEFDDFCVGQQDHSYSVHTIYLDSNDWRIYWRAVQGEQDRWKLRLRYYDDHSDKPVFCEVRHQTNDVIVKHRGGVRREAVNSLLDGYVPHGRDRRIFCGSRTLRDDDARMECPTPIAHLLSAGSVCLVRWQGADNAGSWHLCE